MVIKLIKFSFLILFLTVICLIKKDFVIKFETIDRIIVINAFLFSGLLCFFKDYLNRSCFSFKLLVYLIFLSLLIYFVAIFINNFNDDEKISDNLYLRVVLIFDFLWCVMFTICLFINLFCLLKTIEMK